VIVVETPAEVQVERMLRDRGWTREDAEARIAAQATPEQRRAIATHLVVNTGSREELRARVEEVFRELVGVGEVRGGASGTTDPHSGGNP
jgi:dephospho-CoA kinase